ncbi:MAG: glycosyltransferase family 2 protein [Alphaproteobacteria bacterium]|nr:glycosyltransferase family 2 protein [Alphaproteobacteria bacterium]
MPRINLVWNQSNTFGLSQDAANIEAILHDLPMDVQVVRLDPLQPPSPADIVIHLEVPHPVWFTWAPTHIWVPNPEWCSPNWLPLAERFTQVWVKEYNRVNDFGKNAIHMPWAVRGPLKPIKTDSLGLRQALWVLGASQNKHIAARALLPLWPQDFPLIVTTTLEETDLPGPFPVSVQIKRGFLKADELEELNQSSATHVCISAAEGYGFTAAQAEARSAAMILNTLPVYKEYYEGKGYAGFIQTPCEKSDKNHVGFIADFSRVTTENIKSVLQTIPSGQLQVEQADKRWIDFKTNISRDITNCLKIARPQPRMPPVTSQSDCPKISVLTLTYNRRNFIELAFLNLLVSDYPKDKIQWVVVEDSDDPLLSSSDKIKQFEERQPGIEITYVPMTKKRSIGYKRNKAVQAAKYDICVNMDDDDVYPESSFRRRVSWLMAYPEVKVAGCTMIAMYDLQKGISAVNTPPWALKQCERVSEASFCFWKSYALEHPFPDQQQCEGETFVPQDERFMEIPPQQVLVALNHGKNTSSRVIAGLAETGCFWGWDKQFITWLHGLIGVEVEAI